MLTCTWNANKTIIKFLWMYVNTKIGMSCLISSNNCISLLLCVFCIFQLHFKTLSVTYCLSTHGEKIHDLNGYSNILFKKKIMW